MMRFRPLQPEEVLALWGLSRILIMAGLFFFARWTEQRIEEGRRYLHTARTEGVYYQDDGSGRPPQKIQVGRVGVYLGHYVIFNFMLCRLVFIGGFAVYDAAISFTLLAGSFLALAARLTAS